jgi:hypothetical protein
MQRCAIATHRRMYILMLVLVITVNLILTFLFKMWSEVN